MEGWRGLLGFTILLSFHGPIGLIAAISYRASLLDLVSFFLSFWAFTACYFCIVSLLSFLGSARYYFLLGWSIRPYLFLSFFSEFCGPLARPIAYQSLSFISSLLVIGLFCCWTPFALPCVYAYVCFY